MSTLDENVEDVSKAIDRRDKRIQELLIALNRLVLMVENTISESDGQWPQADSGCIDCTTGTVPNNRNTGPCAFHSAKRLLGQL